MKKYCLNLRVASADHLTDHHVLLKLTNDDALPEMFPGQFVEVRIDHSPSTFLRRPISINLVDLKRNELWLLVAAVGDGTRQLYQLKSGDTVNCLLPLGNGFSMPIADDVVKSSVDDVVKPSADDAIKPYGDGLAKTSIKDVLLVGGGVGVAPLLWQGLTLKKAGLEPTFLLGARSAKDLLELDLFKEVGPVYITTEDDSAGEKGFVTNHSILQRKHFDLIQTCGPKPMMKAVAAYARDKQIDCEASLENMMACGLGACLCCVEKTQEGNLRVCQDGPVFNTKKLLW